MGTTLRHIAQSLGVSHTTVSRVLSGKGAEFISETTRNRVLEAAAALNYRPNRVAQALATGRTGLIGIWVEDLRSPDFVSIASHAVERLRGQPRDPVVRAMDLSEHTVQTIAAWQVDGILAVEGLRYIKRLIAAGLEACPPIVHMGAFPSEHLDHVRVDLYPAAEGAMRHLVAVGCRRIALLTNHWLLEFPGEPRCEAYAKVMGDSGLPVEHIVTWNDDRSAAHQAVLAHVRGNGCPDGLFCVHDGLAMAAYRALVDCGLRVPGDCALVGCDGLDDTAFLEPPISTIVYPVDEMCALAWRLLESRMDMPVLPMQQEVLPARFVARGSSEGRCRPRDADASRGAAYAVTRPRPASEAVTDTRRGAT